MDVVAVARTLGDRPPPIVPPEHFAASEVLFAALATAGATGAYRADRDPHSLAYVRGAGRALVNTPTG